MFPPSFDMSLFVNILGLELDFVQEGVNGERIARMVEHRTDVLIPKVHWE